MNLKNILLDKASRQELAHFYILETSATENAHSILLDFAHDFIKAYYQKVEDQKMSLSNLMDHPDVLVLGNLILDEDSIDKPFKVEEAETLGRFFEFKAVQGRRKFAVITEAHRISSTIANKWLKLLEEPYGLSTIFLLNPRRGQLLPTIHSRAIHLRHSQASSEEDLSSWNDFLSGIKEMPLSEFLEAHGKGSVELSQRVNELICWEATQTEDYPSKDHLKKWLETFQEMEVFHQPTATKWTLFYAYLRENVLDRLSR